MTTSLDQYFSLGTGSVFKTNVSPVSFYQLTRLIYALKSVNFFSSSHRKLVATDLRFKRYLYDKINWDMRLIGLKGARGVGKTTMLMQHIKETFSNVDDAFYVSLDNLWFNSHNLEDLVEFLYSRGVCNIYFDEVHRFKDWTMALKNFYDNYPDLNIVYTGSAMLAIDNSVADLSRRQSLHTLNGLSFREYLEYEGIMVVPPIELEDLLANHTGYAMEITSKTKILKHFNEYLRHGFYPYYKEAGEDYLIRIGEVTRLVIESDIPSAEDITYATTQKIKKLLMVIAENVPFEPNINKLASQLESTRDQTLKMLYLLDRAALLQLLTDKIKDYKHLTGPKKIYLDNVNLMYALSGKIRKGQHARHSLQTRSELQPVLCCLNREISCRRKIYIRSRREFQEFQSDSRSSGQLSRRG